MKNTVRNTFLVIFSALFFLNSAFAQEVEKGIGDPLPAFNFEGLDGKRVTPASFPANQPMIVIYFDPWCDHCQKQAGWINAEIAKFKGISLLWVSFGSMEDTKAFPGKYFPGVVKKDMIFSVDSQYMMDKFFGYSEVPSIYIYNKAGIRVKSFKHETEVAKLLSFAK